MQIESKKKLTVILGGCKIEDKLSVLSYLIEKANTILIGGAMAHPFLQVMYR